ncbi:MAG TPA: nicotinate-nucleotide--dimethylbenzimidazole phosphoribosyltransferase [Sphaerochaeta sp.]|nr:nicotinate-nucleotide--dimethylbenzimidazole phosphoribosyltransferase [Sphaerochaeta sp.]
MQIPPLDTSLRDHYTEQLLKKAMLPHSLGALARVAVDLALITEEPLKNPIHLLFAADHGITAEGVTHSPQKITYQQTRSFGQGGGACSLFARLNGIEQWVIDVGVRHAFAPEDGVLDYKVAWGSENFASGPAMSETACAKACGVGVQLVTKAHQAGKDLIIFGEMGVGNSSSASAVASAILGCPASLVTGKGSGLSDSELAHKVQVIENALKRHTDRAPLAVLEAVGGLEIAAIVGGILGSAKLGLPILIDGAVVSSAALVAAAMEPAVKDYLFFAHRSAMNGHVLMLDALGCTHPLLDLGMQLGEGTGALLAWPLLRAASSLLGELASFEEAKVFDSTAGLQERGLL